MKLLTAVVFMAAFFMSSAQAQNACHKRAYILEMLSIKYSESIRSIGVTNKGGLIEVLTSKDGSTWTLLVTTPQGFSCLVAAGEGWRTLKKEEATDEQTGS